MSAVDAFKSAVPRIRDILRSMGITGMDSMTHICLYVLSRYITVERAKVLGFPERFAWENVINMVRRKNGGTVFALEYFYAKSGECMVEHFDRLFGTNKFSFDVTDPKKHVEILLTLDPIDLNLVDDHMDILGFVYEQHLGTGSGAARDTGQFFTPRQVCEYMTELCKPKLLEDGTPESMCDPTMGTGGFLTSFVKYYHRAYPDATLNWREHRAKIQGCDTDGKVAGVARINFYMETGGALSENLLVQDSLKNGLPSEDGYDVILANMPFGIKGIVYEDIAQKVRALKIPTNNAETLFMQLIMLSLKPGGRCAVVVPTGFLSNSTVPFVKTRKYLLEHFDLQRIVHLNGRVFLNTSIGTSIVFFRNGGTPTRKVEFYDLDFDAKRNSIETKIITLDVDDINGKSYLIASHYLNDSESSGSDIATHQGGEPMTTLRLQDVCTHANGKPLAKEDRDDDNGEYPVMNGGKNYHGSATKFNREGEVVTISKSGSAGFVKWHVGKIWAGDCLTLHPKEGWNLKFIYYYLKLNPGLTRGKVNGSVIPHCKWDDIKNLPLPFVSLEEQKEVIEILDALFNEEPGLEDEIVAITPKAIELALSAPGCSHLLSITDILRCKLSAKTLISQIEAQIKTTFFCLVGDIEKDNVTRYPRMKIKDLAKIEGGSFINAEGAAKEGEEGYPIYGGGGPGKYLAPTFNRENCLVVAKDAVSENCVRWVRERFFMNHHAWTLLCNSQIMEKYLYYSLRLKQHCIYALATGSAQKGINRENFEAFRVIVPPLSVQGDVVRRLDALQAQIDSLNAFVASTEDNARESIQAILSRSTPNASSSGDVPEGEPRKSAEEEQVTLPVDVVENAPKIVTQPKKKAPARSRAKTAAPLPVAEEGKSEERKPSTAKAKQARARSTKPDVDPSEPPTEVKVLPTKKAPAAKSRSKSVAVALK